MGKRAKRERDRRRLAPPPPPPPGTSPLGFACWLGHGGIILVLFETPSGFAVLHYDGVKLFRPKALEAVCIREFRTFEDKASAINSNHVCSGLAKMIKRSLWHDQKLAVGKQEYKDIIEASLGIHCLFDEAVLEVMWGLKNLIKVLVPDEKLELTNEDRLQTSQGLKSVLDRHGFEVDANLVNSDIIDMACTVYESDRLVDERASVFQYGSKKLEEVSGIDSMNWDRLKLATALMLICYPKEEIESGDSEEMLSNMEAARLVADAHHYEDKLDKWIFMKIDKEIVWARGVRRRVLIRLGSMVKEAKQRFEPAPGVHGQ